MPSYTIPLAVAARLDSGRYMSSRVGLGQLLQHAVTPRGGKERKHALAGGVHATREQPRHAGLLSPIHIATLYPILWLALVRVSSL